jgi:hypothetical protein
MAARAIGRSAHAVLTAWLGGLPLSLEWNKAHLINHLAGVHGYRHYLELCTFMSGGRYDEIDRAKLPTCRWLIIVAQTVSMMASPSTIAAPLSTLANA